MTDQEHEEEPGYDPCCGKCVSGVDPFHRHVVNNDPDGLECYSDHAHDIRHVGACMFCGSDDANVIGHVLPDITRYKGITDPVKMSAIVVGRKSATIFDGVLLDHYSASAIQAVYGALSTPEAKDKLRAMPLARAVDVCFKLTR